jgi:quinol monooxygenase YgiN
MVIFVTMYNIHPDKVEAFLKWSESALKRILAVPGVVEFRAYLPITGAYQVVTTLEFADLAAWASYNRNEDIQAVLSEEITLTQNMCHELWGPNSVIPAPIRPGK